MTTSNSLTRSTTRHGLAFLVGGLMLLATASSAQDQRREASAPRIDRPQDIDMWVAVGVTLRMQAADPKQPGEFRLIRMEPEAYRHLKRTGAFKNGTLLAASFHGLQLDDTHAPPLYSATSERVLAVEVIDERQPDGRFFYVFAGDAATAEALPQGNSCATCHNARGSFKGVFASLYPGLAGLVKERGPAQSKR